VSIARPGNVPVFGGSAKGNPLRATGSRNSAVIGGSGKKRQIDLGRRHNNLLGAPEVNTFLGQSQPHPD
jgi:hypothetical protein